MEERLQVGIISSTHGVCGEAKVFPTTDDPSRFYKLKEVIVDQGRAGCKTLEIVGVKFSKKMVVLKFAGIDRVEEIEKYRGMGLYVTRENAVKLDRDEYFIADLIGLTVYDETETEIGTLQDVVQTGANDVYSIRLKDGRELLLPAIRQCILQVDVAGGFLKVHVLEGLLE